MENSLNKINVLSLFDGMSCGQIALKENNVKINNYYASEIDKFAIQQTQLNFPNTIQLGDINNWKTWNIDWKSINLVLAGSPCQGFSFAGKQLNFSDPRSALFFVFIDILNHIKKHNPDVKFLLENVNMKKEYLRIISEYLGIFPVRINSNLVSAQNRDRWYWTNIKTKDVGLFSELWSDIPQPEDKSIFLKDILLPENEVSDKFILSKKLLKSFLNKPGDFGHRFKPQIEKINPKAVCLTANIHKIQITCDFICVAMRGRNPENPSDRKTGSSTEQRLELKTDGKTNCLTNVAKDNLILQKPHGFNNGGEFKDKSPTLLSNSWEHNNHVYDGFKLRRLTPLECARLQTIPTWYIWKCSDTQSYKMLGNGWTIEVIKHILSFL